MIPKHHGAKLHDIPDEHLTELLPVAKKIAIATGAEQYNILQNNGRMAHQMVDHVHCKSDLESRSSSTAHIENISSNSDAPSHLCCYRSPRDPQAG